jgi:hypothetical protein
MISVIDTTETAPDLLRRFVSTPHQGFWQVRHALVSVATNSEEVLHCFPQPPISNSVGENSVLQMKIILDTDLRLAVTAVPLAAERDEVLFGRSPDMFFALDREAQESMVFLRRFDRLRFSEFVLQLVGEQLAPFAAAAS